MSSAVSQSDTLQVAGAGQGGNAAQVPQVKLDGTEAAIIANFNTVPVRTSKVDGYSVQFSTPGGSTLVGVLTVQGSNDRSQMEDTNVADVTVSDWTTLAVIDLTSTTPATRVTSKAVASGAQNILLGDFPCLYRWMRVVFTFTSGSGQPKVTWQQKGYS